MKAEIIAVGTELLLGNIVNTNAQYLSQELAALGFDMYYQSVVGDNFNRLTDTIKTAVNRSNVVIITGGLGPTPDDLSKEAAAEALELPLYIHEESLEQIKSYFAKSGRTMSESNKKQALFPKENCIVIPNDNGTAPGCIMTAKNGNIIALMPGVPYEMKMMFQNSIKPYLQKLSGKTIVSKN
ncbi:MAG: competence/damage-inducible protein A, partial [Clostridia bacterium]|nr:competence/damage-inducible protein A [Clostridia bacterium]